MKTQHMKYKILNALLFHCIFIQLDFVLKAVLSDFVMIIFISLVIMSILKFGSSPHISYESIVLKLLQFDRLHVDELYLREQIDVDQISSTSL